MPVPCTVDKSAEAASLKQLSFTQQRLWFLHQLDPDGSACSMPALYRLQGSVNKAMLEHALNEVVRRHEILRTVFQTVDGKPMQVIIANSHLSISSIDLRALPPADR